MEKFKTWKSKKFKTELIKILKEQVPCSVKEFFDPLP